MNRRLRHLLAISALTLLTASACKQEDREIAPKDYAQELAFGYCEAVYSCSCESYPYANFNACYAEVSVGYAEVANEAYAAGLAYDGTCPVKELDQINNLACKSSVPELPSGVCIPPCNAWYGPLPAGSFCEIVASSAEVGVGFSTCAQGLSCIGGVCVNPCQLVDDLPGLGQPCPQFVCATGATCDLESQICVALPQLPGPGEACVDSACDPERAVCVIEANVCAALPTLGQPCLMGQCGGDTYCSIDDVCVAKPALACGLLGGGGFPGDGDGDGDPTTGDGDGDPTTGDGDGDPTTGDGDGDPGETWDCGDGQQIPIGYVCDGGQDCTNNADEIDGCGELPYICNDGTHIPSTWECDNVVDCAGGEDEAAC